MSDKALNYQERITMANNSTADSAATMVDAVTLGTIYTMFFAPVLHQFLEEIGKYFLFPLAAGAHVVKSILSWRQAKLDQWKSRSVVPAVVETIATAAIITAVVGALASGLFLVATPLIFTAVMGGKMLFQAGSAVYYAGKAAATHDPVEKRDYRTLAIKNTVGAIAGAVATAAVACVFVFGIYAVAALGVVGAAMLGVFAAVKAYQSHQASKAPAPINEPDNNPDSSYTIAKGLDFKAGDLRKSQDESVSNVVAIQAASSQPIVAENQLDNEIESDTKPLLPASFGNNAMI